MPKLKCRLPFRSRIDLVGIVEDRRVAIGHRPGDPQSLALLELRALDLDVFGEGAAVARRGREEAQELLGGGVQQGVALAAEPLALVRMLRQPFQRVRGQRGGGVEAAADDQARGCPGSPGRVRAHRRCAAAAAR